jgi:hypothetical protein
MLTAAGNYDVLVAAVELFQKYDADNSQALSKEEVSLLMQELGQIDSSEKVRLDCAFMELDRDGKSGQSHDEGGILTHCCLPLRNTQVMDESLSLNSYAG